MVCHPNGRDRLNCFALVTYIPNPLAGFLDDLRRELVPGCVPHAHVTILPPRPIGGAVEAASQKARSLAADFPPFAIEAAQVEIFPVTDVVYLGIGVGDGRLHKMHDAMNVGPLQFQEPYPYHPHITLAQDLDPGQAEGLADLARRRWQAFPHARRFWVDTLTFVQNTASNQWVDLAYLRLAATTTA